MPRRLFLNIDSTNQLGNQLFLFASLIACAKKHHATVVNLGFYKYAQLFPTTAKDMLCCYPARSFFGLTSFRLRWWLYRAANKLVRSAEHGRLRRFVGPHLQVLHSGNETTVDKPLSERKKLARYLDEPELAASLEQHSVTVFQGPLFRDMPALYQYADAVRMHFRPTPDCTRRIVAAMAPLRANCDVIVGTHVRRGDYEHFAGGRYYFRVEQYAEAMRRVASLFPGQRVGFWVCSNESLTPADFPGLNIANGPGSVLEDLYSLAQCDYLLGPPSTFSAWASFYGQVPLYMLRDTTATPTREAFVVVDTPAASPT